MEYYRACQISVQVALFKLIRGDAQAMANSSGSYEARLEYRITAHNHDVLTIKMHERSIRNTTLYSTDGTMASDRLGSSSESISLQHATHISRVLVKARGCLGCLMSSIYHRAMLDDECWGSSSKQWHDPQ